MLLRIAAVSFSWRSFCIMAIAVLVVASGCLTRPGPARAEPVITAGVLKFGTVNWLLDTVQHHRLDRKEGYKLEQLELARRDATSVALLAGEVDTIVADWLWALRERSAGEPLVFYPYSRTLGALIVRPDGSVRNLENLKGKKIGVAGGPLDKSWLLLRAWGRQQGIGDLQQSAQPVFAAPPLLAEKMRTGELDAVLIYWHYAARLEAAGFKQLHGVDDFMRGLGVGNPPPLIGFLFRKPKDEGDRQKWAGFMRSLQAASQMLIADDGEWDRLRPKMGVVNDDEFRQLRDRFREGRLDTRDPTGAGSAEKLFEILVRAGGDKVTGPGVQFDAAVFETGLPQ